MTNTSSNSTAGDMVAFVGAAPEKAGGIVYWDRSNGCNRPDMARAWMAAGLPPTLLVHDKTPDVALREAMDDVCTKQRFRRRSPDGGWLLVAETFAGDKGQWAEAVRVSLDKVGRLVVTTPVESDSAAAIRAELVASYERHLWWLSGSDVTGWLVSLAKGLHAVSLSDTGGIYFLPQPKLELWARMVAVVKAVSRVNVYNVAAVLLSGDDAAETIRAIVAAVEREAALAADKMFAELSETGELALGKRALATRTKALGELQAKVASYGELLGVSMDGLSARLSELSAAVATAAMAAESSEVAA